MRFRWGKGRAPEVRRVGCWGWVGWLVVVVFVGGWWWLLLLISSPCFGVGVGELLVGVGTASVVTDMPLTSSVTSDDNGGNRHAKR